MRVRVVRNVFIRFNYTLAVGMFQKKWAIAVRAAEDLRGAQIPVPAFRRVGPSRYRVLAAAVGRPRSRASVGFGGAKSSYGHADVERPKRGA